MAYEKIKECVPDIDAALAFLKGRGFRTFYLIGASTGANKICVYNMYKRRNAVAKYVLLCGGDDVGIYYQLLGREKFWNLFAKAKQKKKVKRGEDIVKELLPDSFFSYDGFFDIANPDGDYNVFPFYEALHKVRMSKKPLFRHFKSIRKPTLVVYGDQDEYAWGDVSEIVDILRRRQPAFDYRIIKGADHGFHGREKQLSRTIADWLK
jgi:pimeloyl-ACP methyl ester carboxylesterase